LGSHRPIRVALVLGALACSTAQAGVAQNAQELAATCVSVGGATAACDAGASAASWIMAGASLLASASATTPDLHRTVGRRAPGGTPRTGFDVRIAFAPLAHPALSASGSGVVDRTQIALGIGAVIGVYEGLQLYPAVGGVFALDGLLGYTRVNLPTDLGYEKSADVQTFGVRLGLLRESFSAPGVAVTVIRSLGDPLIYTGEGSVVNVDPTTTAVRLAAGKDLLGLGLHAAIGRDWMTSNVRLGVPGSVDGTAVIDGTLDRVRSVVQIGASMNFLIVRIQADAGVARGGGGPAFGGLDSEGGSVFGALAVRLIL